MTEEKTIANMDELELFKRLQKLMILAREKKDIEEELEFRHREGKLKYLAKKVWKRVKFWTSKAHEELDDKYFRGS